MRSSSDTGESGETTDTKDQNEKCDNSDSKNLYIVGIGPGDIDHMSKKAFDIIESADIIVGYTTYIELIKELVEGKTIISTSMKKEVDRVQAAIDSALGGKKTVIISSGDPGIYAMAGLAFEICEQKDIPIIRSGYEATALERKFSLQIEVIPGIPALSSGASLLGAPLTHDFAVISLSDLLTPWKQIEKRVEGAAMADFSIVLFNPKSKKRDWQLAKAQELILKHRDPETPVGIVKSAMREEESVKITTLGNLDHADVDMLTTVFVGNSTTSEYMNFMITPRGYGKKYTL
ncbi:MAG: precorrin-3B C(17)-methyltransferase [Deltaproteobacteria bacterium]|nr:precorrin-3B C(17)-methyltransferase [Deltaproteobacteria bacterium]